MYQHIMISSCDHLVVLCNISSLKWIPYFMKQSPTHLHCHEEKQQIFLKNTNHYDIHYANAL